MMPDMVRFLPAGWLAYPLLIICLAVPIAEELFIRRLLPGSYESIMSRNEALVCKALALALVHDTVVPLSLFRFFVQGLILCVIRRKTGSLIPCMAYHVDRNTLLCLLAVLHPR
ncbi:MAG: CPBP family intramembrane glutamic endopeptidase [Thermodesulfobacteriota bacterium]